jgi:glutathione S-transferase
MKVLGHDGSPFVRKVRLALEEKRIPYEYVHARSSEPNSPVPQHNPLSKIPVLITDSGKALYDSPVIVEYIEGLVREPSLIPTTSRAASKSNAGRRSATASSTRPYSPRTTTTRFRARSGTSGQRDKIERGLAAMAKDLGEREFCFGAAFSLADITTGTALGYLDQVLKDYDWRPGSSPASRALAERLAKRDSFRKTLAKT